MNRQFAERQAQVLEILEILAKEASKRKETLVFMGGSAVQAAALKKPRRLSVDLDVYYSGNAQELLEVLKGGYSIEKRATRQKDLFDFYSAIKGNVKVKIDFARFKLSKTGEPYSLKALGQKGFKAHVATPDYLLASKLCALAVGTAGRREFSPIDFLKDVFDSNALIDECGISLETLDCFGQVCKLQNEINKSSFTEEKIIENLVQVLLDSALTDDRKASIKGADLGNFNFSYSLQQAIRKPDYWTMACRLAAYAQNLTSGVKMPQRVEKIETDASGKYADKAFVDMCEEELAAKKIDAKQLHELKILAPKALIYLYYAHYPPRGGPITSKTPGVFNPRYS